MSSTSVWEYLDGLDNEQLFTHIRLICTHDVPNNRLFSVEYLKSDNITWIRLPLFDNFIVYTKFSTLLGRLENVIVELRNESNMLVA